MRGKVCSPIFTPLVCGITPAYAGKRLWGNNRRGRNEDHPRVCGEKFIRLALPDLHRGSPPRMRGKERLLHRKQRVTRITPAYAGKSACTTWRTCAPRDHPRVCGEKAYSSVIAGSLWGSPPRMRGKGTRDLAHCALNGITPAYAGKRMYALASGQRARDHPRVCGEKNYHLPDQLPGGGSPPRMRGKAVRLPLPAVGGRITPAYAGKRCWCGFSGCLGGDHPRVCGEKTKKIPSHRPFQLHPVPVSFSFA